MRPPFGPNFSIGGAVVGFLCLLFLVGVTRIAFHQTGGSTIGWTIKAAIVLAIFRVGFTVLVSFLARTPPVPTRPNAAGRDQAPPATDFEPSIGPSPAALARARIARAGGGAYLGLREDGSWALAASKHAVLVLGPPQSGKTSGGLIPLVMASSGALVSASTKPDVMEATLAARSELGQAWLFDPPAPSRCPTACAGCPGRR